MDKPQPKTDLAVRRNGVFLYLTPHTLDAREWISHNCAEFGEIDNRGKVSVIKVLDGYNVDEIAVWIQDHFPVNE